MDAEELVRALAAQDAPIDSEYGTCAFCDAQDPNNLRAAPIPGAPMEHEPSCLWRLAREWVAANSS